MTNEQEKGKSKGSVIPVIILAIIAIWAYNHFLKSSNSSTSIQSNQNNENDASVSYPVAQGSFHSLNRPYSQQYEDAPNEIQKSAVFNSCNQARKDFF